MKKHRRHKVRRVPLLNALKKALSGLRAHSVRAGCFAAVAAVLCYFVVTKSLPYAVAEANPAFALALNPNNPAALMAKAGQLRERLLRASDPAAAETAKADAQADTIGQLPKAGGEGAESGPSAVAALRMEIRKLALRALANDPLNARAFQLWAETATDYSEARSLMLEAAKRSRRNEVALFWLLNDSFYHKNFQAVLNYADLLLRTHPELSAYVFSYLSLIAETPEGAPLLVQELEKSPFWRVSFFNALPKHIKDTETPLRLMLALKEAGKPPVYKELAPYLDFLIGKNLIEAAYNAWSQFLSPEELDSLNFITHANFEGAPSGVPFDWRIALGRNAVAEFISMTPQSERALHIGFGYGRVQFPEVSQVILLPSGKYRLTGKLKGSILGKRGLRWQIRCFGGSGKVLGESEMLMGKSQEWRVFQLEAEITEADDCRAQTLRLFHDSRSASEELLTGEVWFVNLHLERLPDAVLQ